MSLTNSPLKKIGFTSVNKKEEKWSVHKDWDLKEDTKWGHCTEAEAKKRPPHTAQCSPRGISTVGNVFKAGSFASSGTADAGGRCIDPPTSPSHLYHEPTHRIPRKSPWPREISPNWKSHKSYSLLYSVPKHLCARKCTGNSEFKRQEKRSQSLRNSQPVCVNNDTIKIQCVGGRTQRHSKYYGNLEYGMTNSALCTQGNFAFSWVLKHD